ncbi:hypothetical protein L6164_028936 [Bauhinia variegata]|uniref:Uncharacterized protein n=1 Tax=Bauhinia variegata TaxID=167791 RepID=A0ACB9L769_BAUVA|nr:hypothetical protein L6164_028936 [Bauhinia variegata]
MGSFNGISMLQLEDKDLLMSPSAPISKRKIPFEEDSQIGDLGKFSLHNVKSKMRSSIRVVILSAKISLLMPFGPMAILADKLFDSHGLVFLFSLLGILPLAERLGYTTEQLSCFTGPTVGGLLSATFGNATELIISIRALKTGMVRVVQQSLLGSILSNLLLVLGCAFFAGGIVIKREQSFNNADASVDFGLLLMAVMGLLFPAVLHSTETELEYGESQLSLSRFTSCIMLMGYGSYIVFQLKRQNNLRASTDEEKGLNEESLDDVEAPEISMRESIIWLFILTAWISILSDYLVNTIEGASRESKMPIAFISVILLPVVGNAAEHAGAVMFAVKDKLDISLGVAVGSSIQISMFVIPLCVVVGWKIGCPMNLNFELFETCSLFMTVILVAFLLHNGTSNCLKGLMLIFCYMIVAASFFLHDDYILIEN